MWRTQKLYILLVGMQNGVATFEKTKGRTYKKKTSGDFPGGPAVKTPCSQCRGPGFDPWSGN